MTHHIVQGPLNVAAYQSTQKPAGVAQFHETDPAHPGGELLRLRVQGVTPLVPCVLSPGPLCPSLSLRVFSCTQSQLVAWPGGSCPRFLLELSHGNEARSLPLRREPPHQREGGAGSGPLVTFPTLQGELFAPHQPLSPLLPSAHRWWREFPRWWVPLGSPHHWGGANASKTVKQVQRWGRHK